MKCNFQSHKVHYSICTINLRTHSLMISLSLISYSGMKKIWMIFEKQLLIMKMKVAEKEIQVFVGTHCNKYWSFQFKHMPKFHFP